MKKTTQARIAAAMLVCACAFAYLGTGTLYSQTGEPAQADPKKDESQQKAAVNPAPGSQVDLNGARISVLQSRNPLESGINARYITSRAFINYVQMDITGGVFLPTGDLAGGMDYGTSFGINMRTPFTHLVIPSQLGSYARYFSQVDVGLHFSYITGESSRRNTDTITFAPLLLEAYYSLPFNTGRFKVYAYNGLGISLISTVVERSGQSVNRQSYAFTIRPGIGSEYFFTGRVYVRLNLGYLVCMESVIATGMVTTLGAGYLF